jgi:hypothetical protein
MDAEPAYVTLSVSGADQRINITENATAALLFDAVADALDASTVKLLHKGKRLTRDDPLTPGMRVLCLGTTTRQKTMIAAQKSDPTIRGFKAEAQREAARRGATEDFAQHPEYKFCRIEAVKRFDGRGGPHRFEAEKLLRSMASEVAPIMVSHAWTVGGLLEMDPRDDQIMKKKQQEGGCLLGYNENMGARIYVKLRQDDGSFHERDALMKTLLHELCHNVVGPHNAVFFALYADVRAEHLALTRKAAGRHRTLADASTKETVARELASEAGNGALQGGERASAAFVANAVSMLPDAPVVAPPPPPAVDAAEQRVASAAAAERRRLGVCKPCAPVAATEPTSAPAVSAPAPSVPAAMELDTPPASAMEVEPAPAPAAPSVPEPPAPPLDPGLASLAAMGFEGPAAAAALKATAGDVSAALERLLNPGAAVSAPETGSRQERVLRASSDLHALGEPARDAAATLTAIMTNAELPEDKFKRVRLGNKKFLRTAGKFAAALRLLEAVGFERETSAEGDVYALKRTDPGLLWLGRSALADLVAP